MYSSHFKTEIVSEKHETSLEEAWLFCIGCGRALHALYRVHKEILFTLNTDLLIKKKTLHNIPFYNMQYLGNSKSSSFTKKMQLL